MRFAVICDQHALEQWQVASIARLSDSGDNEFVGAIVTTSRRSKKKQLTRALIGSPPIGYVPLERAFPNVDCFRGTGVTSGVFRLDHDDRKILMESGVNCVLCFTEEQLSGPLMATLEYGIWMFCYGSTNVILNTDDSFLAYCLEQEECLEVRLLKRESYDSQQAVILREGFFSQHTDTIGRTLNTVFDACSKWPHEVSDAIGAAGEPEETTTQVAAADGNKARLISYRSVMRVWSQTLITALKKFLWQDRWTIGVVHNNIAVFLESQEIPAIVWLAEVPNGFLADPFGYFHDEALHVLCERFDWLTARGQLVEIAWPEDSVPRPRSVCESPFHLSYPYIVRDGPRLWVVPEQHESRRVSLYRWSHDTKTCERVVTIIDGFPALDCSIINHEGTWWLFCTNGDEGPCSVSLYIWYAKHLLGPWKPHKRNPVKHDVRSARPAGTPFVYKGKLYRPAQDCSRTYGGRIVICEVGRLTPDDFQECCVAVVEPDRDWPHPDGTHTLAAVGENLTLIDAKVRVFHLGALLGKLRRRMARQRKSP